MAAHYVRKQTYHQGKRLGEDAKKLYHGHQRHGDFQPSGDLRPEDVFPIGLVSEDVDDEQHTEGEEKRDRDIARYVGSAWENRNQPHQVGDENEEEGRQQKRRIGFAMLFADAGLDEVVIDHHDKHLHQSNESLWGIVAAIAAAIPAGCTKEDDEHQEGDNPNLQHVFRDGQIKRTHFLAVVEFFIYFPVFGLVDVETFVGLLLPPSGQN